MSTMFLSNNDEFAHEITRSLAKGYTTLRIADDVEVASNVQIVSDGTTLLVQAAEPSDDVTEYAILCKEFGLFGYNKKLAAKVSVLFCDEGYMLVTLKKGAVIIRMDDQIVAPSLETAEEDLSCSTDEILWVNAEYMLGYSKYWKEKAKFTQDFEFSFILSGGTAGGSYSFSLRDIADEDKDISLGQYMAYLKQEEAKEAYRDTKKVMKTLAVGSTMEFSFDEADDEEEDDDLVEEEE